MDKPNETRRAAVDLPVREHHALHQAALDLGIPATQLMREGILLALEARKEQRRKIAAAQRLRDAGLAR